jgi:polysaccharide biosynthesis transport protein
MLLKQKSDPIARHEEMPSGSSWKIVDSYLRIARRQYLIILSCLLLAASIGGYYLIATQPVFTASATMRIDSRKGGIQKKSVLGDTPTDTSAIDSQIGVLGLERDKIGLAVAEKLKLANDRDLVRQPDDGLTRALIAPTKPFQRETNIQRENPKSDAELAQQAGSVVAGGLDVKRIGYTYLVLISFSGRNPDQAVNIANAAADAYVIAEMDAKYQAIRQASDWLQERYQALRERASAADRAVIDFRNMNNIVTSEGKLIGDQQVTDRAGVGHRPGHGERNEGPHLPHSRIG